MPDGLSLGKLQAALASATNEVTVAAANINFDFALVKCEAPPEYKPLGQSLTPYRRTEAESGSQHVTARRLGALFEGLIPDTPHLLRTFGKRATEISRDTLPSKWNLVAKPLKALATIWLPSHYPLATINHVVAATSLWVEIVAERRNDIATPSAAVQQKITRDQLAKWDASARAWKQFLLIANIISLSINDETRPYESTIPNLIAGEPLAVKNGSVLLGISAWHIYPNMIVFNGKDGGKSVDMNDPLVHPGGVISLGLSDSGLRTSRGVYWSLSLANHIFYGRPVHKTSELNQDESRLTFTELQMIPSSQTSTVLDFLLQVISSIHYKRTSDFGSWMEMFITPITHYFQDELAAAPLISLGRRREGFIPLSQYDMDVKPFFGLTDLSVLLGLLSSPESKVELLRRLADRVENLGRFEAYIAFRVDEKWYLATALPVKTKDRKPIFETPDERTATNRKRRRQSSHCWWIDSQSVQLKTSPSEQVFPASCLHFDKWMAMLYFKEPDRGLHFLFGDYDNAAVFILDEQTDTSQQPQPPSTIHEDVIWCIQRDLLPPKAIRYTIENSPGNLLRILDSISFGSHIYRDVSMNGATISPGILTAPYQQFYYLDSSPRTLHDDRRQLCKLKYIAYFDTGIHLLKQVHGSRRILGISVGNSIYIPSRLLNDPYSTCHPSGISRLLGNLGRPGLTLMTTPERPEARDINLNSWRLASNEFNGSQLDCFSSTSLHLSFTEWVAPLYQSSAVGQHGFEAVHAEAVVSIRDSGSWVADISIIEALDHKDVYRLPEVGEPCSHPQPSKPPDGATSLETWDQILDCPGGVVVTRSSKNWVARVAIVAVLAQHCRLKPKRIHICPDHVCWECLNPPEANAIYVY
ncbi:hypothetical protein F5B20DRAFT_570240 [Whalleya microplaca]|nr:hypothetical protein F5B20DRAFT_570240 [Whalleya microplaca]